MLLPLQEASFQPPTSHLAHALSRPDSRLGEILHTIAYLFEINRVLGEVTAERDALRAPKWIAPTFEVVNNISRCNHGLTNPAWCAICKEQNGSCVDSRGTAKPYKQSKKHKKDIVTPGADTLWSIVPACDLPAPVARFHQVTVEDVDWATRQTPFPHSEAMPRKAANFHHEFGMYVQKNWAPRDGSQSSIYKNLVADYAEKMLRAWEKDVEFQRTHPKQYFRKPTTELISLVSMGAVSERALRNGGKRVSTLGCSGTDNDCVAIDRCVTDRRSNMAFNAQQAWKYVPQAASLCERCNTAFTSRKGTKFCPGGNCRKRHHEEQRQANNLPNATEATR